MVKFSQLPYELREKIWLDTIEPRLVGLVPHRDKRGRWSVKSTARPPVAMHVNAESRHILSKYYKNLETRSVMNHKPTGIYEEWPVVLDVSPRILFNFDIDTLHFADTTPPEKPLPDQEAQRRKSKVPTNALDLLILKESMDAFQGPGFRLMINASARTQDWPYLLETQDVSHDYIHSGDPRLLNWTHIHYVRFDFNVFLSDLALWWGLMHPFVKWMQQAATRVEVADDPIRSYELVMVNGRGNKRKLQKILRLALRPEKEADAAYQSLSPIERLQQYGAVVFEEVLPTPEGKAILFEVVDPLIGADAISKWKQFSIDKRVVPPPRPSILPRATAFGADMEVLWQMASQKRGLAHGEMSPVHGLCLADYGIDGGFRGRI
ncbi:uncharacterized protein TRIVIDRAFT_230340 [Trichoderma virens Gv29-8]|uniref:2EXR domain-containing protein n=1 Tax=Hypocrea virens (strain Gv29-8 / FGSC 10586) TaxID=413071 RepID=G9MPM5_HYPVG|nr:uncharacterized protein TRIVIDRAFT_230340 [Trichoderma virens Gv29-8]EHK23826.1 hypothetical protein TRIVIDRAFT_230340 [Trichoderma virens Gv29-8]UKZ50128.1 hypothetical protein TrVGV298_004384 [Trichoderma virens]